jgi:hypothetical protein
MSHKKKDRLDTLRVLIGGCSCLCNSSRLTDIYGEINRIATSDQVPRHNGWLLAVLYTTRTLDTLLSEIVRCKGWTAHTANLNGYLVALSQQRDCAIKREAGIRSGAGSRQK